MPQSSAYDLSRVTACLIVFSDRIASGEKEDRATPACRTALVQAGITRVSTRVVCENGEDLRAAIDERIALGDRLILVLGGSGFGVGNVAPETVREVIEVEIPGIAEQIRTHGLRHTPLSGLSREVVGVTARDSHGALIVSSPGSRGGALDTLAVLSPLLPAIFGQLGEER